MLNHNVSDCEYANAQYWDRHSQEHPETCENAFRCSKREQGCCRLCVWAHKKEPNGELDLREHQDALEMLALAGFHVMLQVQVHDRDRQQEQQK